MFSKGIMSVRVLIIQLSRFDPSSKIIKVGFNLRLLSCPKSQPLRPAPLVRQPWNSSYLSRHLGSYDYTWGLYP